MKPGLVAAASDTAPQYERTARPKVGEALRDERGSGFIAGGIRTRRRKLDSTEVFWRMCFASRNGASRAMSFLGLVLAALVVTAPAAAVLQPTPGGFTIPNLNTAATRCSDPTEATEGAGNAEICLDDSEGDPALIDAEKDALIAPEVFQPTCALTFKPIAKGGADHVAFGWYNLKPDPANAGKYLTPAQAELYGMFVLAYGGRSGAQLAGESAQLDLAKEKAAGRYEGGEIGFFLAGGSDFSELRLDAETHALTGMSLTRVFYTQHALNPGSSGASTYYQVLTWQSVKLKNAFYFGWEDREASSDADNDFDDLMFLVTGIQCSGGGEPCDTGKDGVCKDGTQQCAKGELTCVQNVQPSAEKCNALDDDCNGEVDDGDGLCDAGKVCDRGRCVPKCGTGEFRCPQDLICNDRHLCVEAACATVDCPSGQVCQGGQCVDGCSGVTCPYGEVCRNGGCVDPCTGITCDDGYSCVLGVCSSCACTSCTGAQVCGKDNVCVDAGCQNQTCMAGSHCAAGGCVDDCAGTKCPVGQVCALGACVADAQGGGGTGGGAPGSGGSDIVIDPGSAGSGASSGSGQGGNQGQTLGDGAGDSGCGCSVPGGRSKAGGALALLLLGLGLRGRRRHSAASA
jgi:MYXO-CTERM domain-containing protein